MLRSERTGLNARMQVTLRLKIESERLGALVPAQAGRRSTNAARIARPANQIKFAAFR
jgi:hypothetical protein